MLSRDDAIAILRANEAALRARGVVHAAIFGSVARGDADRHSDVDVLIATAPERTFGLMELGAIQDLLDRRFVGTGVDLVFEPVTRAGLAAGIARDRVNAF